MQITKIFIFCLLAITCIGASPILAAENTTKNNKILVTFFSLPETTNPIGMSKNEENSTVVIDGKVLGNTEYMAYVIQEATKADIFRIEPETAYPLNHRKILDMAAKEQETNARPKIKNKIQNIEQYEVVFIGYPNWNGDLPMILYTFLEEYNLAGKRIIPFCTHGGSGLSGTVNTISKLQTGATVEQNALSISRNAIQNSKEDIENWVKSLNINIGE